MANLIQIQNNYNENLLPVSSLLSNSTVVNFSGDGTVSIQDDFSLTEKSKSLEVYSIQDLVFGVDYSFDLGSALTYSVLNDGLYAFQFAINNQNINASAGYTVNLVLTIFVDGLPNEFTIPYDLTSIENGTFSFFTQTIFLNAGEVVDFSFNIQADSVGSPNPNFRLNFSGFKLELLNKNTDNLPTDYSLPIDYNASSDINGYAYYVDSLATPTIVVDTSYTEITIDDLGASILDYLPKEIRGVSQLWTTNKITPIAIGDDYDGRLDVTVTTKTGSPTFIEFIIDISGSTAGTNKAFTGYIQNIGVYPYDQSLPLDFFTLDTFLANGGKLYARTDAGTVTIGRRNIKISRKSKYFA